jgi:monoterpene epsilon-lactone hydrolase
MSIATSSKQSVRSLPCDVASWQARSANVLVRVLLRRRSWGDENQLAHRARRLLGTPAPFRRVHTRGMTIAQVDEGGIRGEWIEPKEPRDGAILYMHGGGYVSCSPGTHRPITGTLARLTGRRVFSLDYRLAPENRFPAAIDDALAAYRWMLEEQSIPANRIAVGGDSAGGGLTLALLLKAREDGLPLPACAFCFSPWTDLTGGGASIRGNDGLCVMFTPENIEDFATAYLGDASPLEPLASPAYSELGGLPPLLIHVSSTELLLDDSRRVHAAVEEAGGSSRMEIYEGVCHAWQMLQGVVPEARKSLVDAADFIGGHLTA